MVVHGCCEWAKAALVLLLYCCSVDFIKWKARRRICRTANCQFALHSSARSARRHASLGGRRVGGCKQLQRTAWLFSSMQGRKRRLDSGVGEGGAIARLL